MDVTGWSAPVYTGLRTFSSLIKMGKEKASAALFDQLQAAIEGGEGDDIVGKMKVRLMFCRLRYKNIGGIPAVTC